MLNAPIQSANEEPELAKAIGDMMFAWMIAERQLVTCFAVMLDTPYYKASRLYQKLPNYRSRTQALYALMEIHPEFEPLRNPVAKLSGLSKTRNNWVHGSFIKKSTRHLGGVFVINFDENLGSRDRLKPVEAPDITNHADSVRRRAGELRSRLESMPQHKAWQEADLAGRMKAAGRQDTR